MSPERAIDVVNALFGVHARRRALHAKGTFCKGTFEATPEAARLSRAAHLQGGAVAVLARVSNGGGDPTVPDGAPDVRGLAVSFRLPDGSSTDMVAQSVPRFFNRTPAEFMEFVRASQGASAAFRLPWFLLTHPRGLSSIPRNLAALRPVASYAQCRYFGVHAFVWTNARGKEQFVRYSWVPEATEAHLGLLDAKSRPADYLSLELAERLSSGPARFRLEVTLAEPGDVTSDPSSHWPSSRTKIDAGTLALTEVISDPEETGEIVVFDPTRMTDGTGLSDDPFLPYRARAYSESAARRSR